MSALIKLLEQVAKLPEAQREIMVPIFATALLEAAPPGSSLTPELDAQVRAFWAKLERPSPEESNQALEKLLKDAGISAQIFQELASNAGLEAAAQHALGGLLPGAKFQPRAAPQAGQHRGGVAQIALMRQK